MISNYRGDLPGVTRFTRVADQRQEMTDAERRLCSRLRDRRLGGSKFRRQHQFGPYILDFYCAEQRLAVEADGGQHLATEGIESDQDRDRYLNRRGVRVLRLSDREIFLNLEGVLEGILLALGERPSP